MRLDCRVRSDYGIFRDWLKGEDYEPDVVWAITHYLPPSGKFVDVGANSGYHTLLAWKVAGPAGCILSFEPNPAAFNRLVANVALNTGASEETSLRQFNLALSDSSGVAELRISRWTDGSSSLILPTRQTKARIPIKLQPFDSLWNGEALDVIKIDVEGHELPVLRGMSRALESSPNARLIIEWNPDYAGTDLWEYLRARFEVRVLSERGPNEMALRDVRGLTLCNLLVTRSPHVNQLLD